MRRILLLIIGNIVLSYVLLEVGMLVLMRIVLFNVANSDVNEKIKSVENLFSIMNFTAFPFASVGVGILTGIFSHKHAWKITIGSLAPLILYHLALNHLSGRPLGIACIFSGTYLIIGVLVSYGISLPVKRIRKAGESIYDLPPPSPKSWF
jgi:hypothetical protein